MGRGGSLTVDGHAARGQPAVVVHRRVIHLRDQLRARAEVAGALAEGGETVTNDVGEGGLGLEAGDLDVLDLVVCFRRSVKLGSERRKGAGGGGAQAKRMRKLPVPLGPKV